MDTINIQCIAQSSICELLAYQNMNLTNFHI